MLCAVLRPALKGGADGRDSDDETRAKAGSGMLYLRGETWWIKYHQDGRAFYESTGLKDERKARSVLRDRVQRAESGAPVLPNLSRGHTTTRRRR